MQLTPFIISLVFFIISTIWVIGGSFSSAVGRATSRDVAIQWVALVVMLITLGLSIHYGVTNASSESRTSAGSWDTTPSASGSVASAVWASGATSSDLAPGWTIGTDLATSSQQTLINAWLRRTVNTPVVGLTPTVDTDIRSILVRRKNGTTAEIPIMSFFKKLHEDALLAWRQSKDYTDEKFADPSIVRYNTGFKIRSTEEHHTAINRGGWIGGGWSVRLGGGESDGWMITTG